MPYYINAPTLSSATAVYDDPQLTTCAADGYYKEGSVVRQQVGCVLLPEQSCPFCGAFCGVTFSGPVNKGVYYFSVSLGSSTGPVEIRFDPQDFPNGIEATYDSAVYNTVVSPIFGSLSAPAGLPVFIGFNGDDCGILGTHTLEEFEFVSLENSFQNLGTTDVVNVISTQSQLTWDSPDECVMIIPKPNSSPTNLLVKLISPCDLDSFSISISCPGDIDVYSILGSEGGSSGLICGFPAETFTYYVIPVNGDGTTLGLFDMVYYDIDCITPLVDNYYLSPACPSPDNWFRIENGIIVEFGECAGTFNYRVRLCGNIAAPLIEVVSLFELEVGNTVSLSDPIYEDCVFEVIEVSSGETPVAEVLSQSEAGCSEACAYFSVGNTDFKPAIVNYEDCKGDPQTITIPVTGFAYICARVDSITSGQTLRILFENCQCPT